MQTRNGVYSFWESNLCYTAATNTFQKGQLLLWRQTVSVSGLHYIFHRKVSIAGNCDNLLAIKAIARCHFNSLRLIYGSDCQHEKSNWFHRNCQQPPVTNRLLENFSVYWSLSLKRTDSLNMQKLNVVLPVFHRHVVLCKCNKLRLS